jgi:3-oxoadipate enol-lactonase
VSASKAPPATLAYDLAGEGPRVVLIHGVGGVMQNWDGVLERLKSRYTVLRYDLRGHGRSEKRSGAYTLADFVDDHVALLERLGWESAHVVGFSLGGIIAQALAIDHASRVDRLVLVSAIAGRTPAERERAQARARTLAAGGAETHLDAALDRWFTREFQAAHPEVIEQRKRQAADQDPACYAAAYHVLANDDLAGDLHRITHPTLVMTGELDTGSTPRMAALMAGSIPGASLYLLPGLRHSVLLEAPELVAARIAAFLS